MHGGTEPWRTEEGVRLTALLYDFPLCCFDLLFLITFFIDGIASHITMWRQVRGQFVLAVTLPSLRRSQGSQTYSFESESLPQHRACISFPSFCFSLFPIRLEGSKCQVILLFSSPSVLEFQTWHVTTPIFYLVPLVCAARNIYMCVKT